jgi:hypothetical protein
MIGLGGRQFWGITLTSAIMCGANIEAAYGFCVRNDTGAPISVEAVDGTASFALELANNKKACCSPKDKACAIGKADVKLVIGASKTEASCDVTVSPKGNVNVTGGQNALKCKANKAGSTMDWASG